MISGGRQPGDTVVKVGETSVQIKVYSKEGPNRNVVYFNMHDNENTSVQAARAVVDRQGGTLFELVHAGERLIRFQLKADSYIFDPNRIFTDVGIEKTLKKNSQKYSADAKTAVGQFAKSLLAHLGQPDSIVAVHNNTDGNYSLASYQRGGEEESNAAKLSVNNAKDKDDFFFVTDPTDFSALSAAGYNVVLQNNATVVDDGSLSVYCGRQKIRYINVEAQEGHFREQTEMLKALVGRLVKTK